MKTSRLAIGKITDMARQVYYLYVLRSESSGRYYVGHTRDVEERLRRHEQGRSRFTKARGPYRIVYMERYDSRSKAAKREAEIKAKKSRSYLDQLISKSSATLSV